MSVALQSPQQAARWLRSRIGGTLRADSRQLQPGDGFLAWPGAATDARGFVPVALAAGAAACLLEQEGAEQLGLNIEDERLGLYEGLKSAAAPIAAAYFGEPSHQLALLAVTGTNGKTSTAWWLAQALSALGQRCALVGTLGIGEPGAMVFNGLTTPDPVLLQQQLRRLVDERFAACALEASSIGIDQARLDAVLIRTAIFTNFTQDHLDYHGSMAAYWAAKRRLFDWPGLQSAVINVDDAQGAALAAELAGRPALDVWTVSCTGPARLTASAIEHGLQALNFDVSESGSAQSCRVSAPVVGAYNVSNLLGVIAAMRGVGVSLPDAAAVCAKLTPVPGRMDTLATDGQPLVVIDYAHTPDALEKVLNALRPAATGRAGRLWCVIGCGGDRDPAKRPLMAAVAEQHADQIVLTSDNPRSEDPAAIIEAMVAGLQRRQDVSMQVDRARAIEQALLAAQSTDVVLIAGKGHEDYQDIGGVKRAFSDHRCARAALQLRQAASTVRSAGAGATA